MASIRYRKLDKGEVFRHGDEELVKEAGALFTRERWQSVSSLLVGKRVPESGEYRRPVNPTVQRLVTALETALSQYERLVDSGDAGSWNPREEDWHKHCTQVLASAKKTL